MDRKETRLLSDHYQIKKRFIPPFFAALKDYNRSSFHDAKWLERIVPEVLWLALINDVLGSKRGADVGLACAKVAASITKSGPDRIWFAACSAYSKLDEAQQRETRLALHEQGLLGVVQECLYSLYRFYPSFPMAFLYSGETGLLISNPEDKLQQLKTVVRALLNRGSAEATFAQANVVYISFVTEFLVACESTVLAKFPEIQNYPNTEISKNVASAVRGQVSVFFNGELYEATHNWPHAFWCRGRELEQCVLREKFL